MAWPLHKRTKPRGYSWPPFPPGNQRARKHTTPVLDVLRAAFNHSSLTWSVLAAKAFDCHPLYAIRLASGAAEILTERHVGIIRGIVEQRDDPDLTRKFEAMVVWANAQRIKRKRSQNRDLT